MNLHRTAPAHEQLVERLSRSPFGRMSQGLAMVFIMVVMVGGFTLLSRRVFRTDFDTLGTAYHWYSPIIALHVVSNASISIGFLIIAGVLLYVGIRRAHDITPLWLYYLILLLLVFDALAHVFTIAALWTPLFWFMGYFRLATGVLSIVIAVFLARLAPILVKLPGPKAIALVQGQIEMDTDTLQTLIYRLSAKEREVEELRATISKTARAGHSREER
jgi:hypothetical protein